MKIWKLKEIWTNKYEGLGFSVSSWCKNTGKFFKRIFRNDPLIMTKPGVFKDKIEDIYEAFE